MDVKRYDATVEYGPGWDAGASAVMDEAADGDWVEFTDYAAVEAECDRLRAERDAWTETAAQHARNEEFYRGIVTQIGDGFGVAARTADDGSVMEDVLALLVPELVTQLRAERDAAIREAEICKAIIKHCGGSFVVKCMLCGAPYDVRDPDWMKHDLTCPKHPMRDVERERDAIARRMVKAVEVLEERCSRDESPALFAITKCKLALLALTTDALESAGLMGKEVPDGK